MADTVTHTGTGRTSRWRIQDLIDLEYFLHVDTATNGKDKGTPYFPTARDIYLKRLQHPGGDGTRVSRRLLIRGWLDIRRENEAETLPGSIYMEVSRIFLMAAVVIGLFAGISLALSLLDYSGDRPLNVSVYMGVAVFSQILLILLLAMVFFIRTASRSLARGSILVKLVGRMLSTALLKARKGAFGRLEGQKRDALAAAAGLLRGRRQLYGSLFFWPVFILTQAFATCFNVGLLGATLIKLVGSDVAFGWQSTFQVSAQAVSHLVETLAFPWRWMVPAQLACPDLAAIEGSRIILKEGIGSLATDALVSWWPFLCFSVLFYGLLPRLVLLLSGLLVKRHLLARLRFDHGACDRLVRTMVSPTFSTAGAPVAVKVSETAGVSPETSKPAAPGLAGGVYGALVPEDLFTDCDGLEDVAVRELAIEVADRRAIDAGGANAPAFSGVIAAMRNLPGFSGVLVLQEAWQPPIRENLNFLKQLRRQLGPGDGIVVGLIGKPGPDTLFTAPRETDFQIWRRRVEALGDPYLSVERLVSHD